MCECLPWSTKDYLLKTLSQNFKGHRFAHQVGDLLETMGYRTRVSPEGPDKGIDIVAFRDDLGLHPPIIKVQVKSGEGNVGAPRRRWCSRRWAGRRVYRTSAGRAAFG